MGGGQKKSGGTEKAPTFSKTKKMENLKKEKGVKWGDKKTQPFLKMRTLKKNGRAPGGREID